MRFGGVGTAGASNHGQPSIKEGNVYHLWYAGNHGMTLRIGHATSGDGITLDEGPGPIRSWTSERPALGIG